MVQSTATNFSYTFPSAGTYSIALTAINTTCSDVATQTITIVAAPSVSFTHYENDLTTNCSATPVLGASYSWDFGDGSTGIGQNTGHTYSAAGTYNVCLTVTDACGSVSGCENINVIANQACWQNLRGGETHMLALKTDGSLWMWGRNHNSQLGNNSTVDVGTPTKYGNDVWIYTAASYAYSLAIKSDGTLWAWGGNVIGQLGNGTHIDIPIPTQIGNDNDWAKVFVGGLHTFAIKTNGTL